MVSILASRPYCPIGLIPSIPEIFSPEIVNVAEANQRHFLEESGQWLGNVHRTHLVLAIGKLVPQKTC